jgi:hypothetical protein
VRREARLLLAKACDSLVLSIELFNRPHETARVSGTLIQLDHSFEMLLKASILHRGGSIRDKQAKETIGFDACVRRGLSDGSIRFLTDEQALVLQTINGLRDAAQHHLLELSEGQLYVHVQSGVTLFDDLLTTVFQQDLHSHLPSRVLPVSTSPPTDLMTLFDNEVVEIRKLLEPGRRRGVEAVARLRPLAILNAAIQGEKGQPSDAELQRVGRKLRSGVDWGEVFQGVAAIEISTEGAGHAFSLRLSKKEGVPIELVREGTPGAAVVAVKRVDELGFYNLGAQQVADRVGITRPKALAIVEYLKLREDPDCYKEFKIGKSEFKRYSQRAIDRIQQCAANEDVEEVWAKVKAGKRA